MEVGTVRDVLQAAAQAGLVAWTDLATGATDKDLHEMPPPQPQS